MKFSCLFFQVCTKIGMRNPDELLGALTDGLGVQIGNAVFGDHITDVVAAGNHAGAMFEHGGNARDRRPILEGCGARERNDRNAALRS